MMTNMLRPLGALILALALVAAACGDDDVDGDAASGQGASNALLPFELIQDSEFTFDVDAFDTTRGLFHVTTTEPTICSITWGETTELGNINNSLTMNGTGIIQHDVPLPGAEPGKTYHFTVQGSTADGRVFQSEMGTFILPEVEAAAEPAPEMAVHGENLAEGSSIVVVSSEFSAAWSADNAIDGDMSTEWATASDGTDGFIELDLGAEFEIAGFEFITRSMTDGTAITSEYTVSVDGSVFGPFPAGNPADPRFAAATAVGRIVRFEITDSSGGNTGAIEVKVFAPQAMGDSGDMSDTDTTSTTSTTVADTTTTTEDDMDS